MLGKGTSVLLVAHSEYRGVYLGIARRLVEECQADIHLYTISTQESDYYRLNHGALFATITVANQLYEICRQPPPDEAGVIAEARRNEAELGVTITELAVSDRHLGRGFALGGFRHPRSHVSERTSHVQMLNAFNVQIDFWRQELEDNKPDLIINAGKVLCVLARQHNILVRILAGSRYKSFHYWAVNEYLENPAFEPAYRVARPSPKLGLKAPYDAHLHFRARFRKGASLWSTVRAIGYLILRQAYWMARGYDKARGYFLSENISYLWRRYRDIRRLTGSEETGVEGLAGTPFVFFPLATEPETALQMLSPEYFYQLPAIASVARDLPAGVILAVKEHYAAVGRRPRDFYGQIREFKSVQMLNMAKLGMEAARAAAAVVTISGTSGFEGAIMGRPVISFGRHNIYNFLPHVMVVTDEAQLKSYLRRALSDDFDAEQAKRDGRRFLQAVIDVSFDLADFAPIEPDKVSDAAVDAAYAALRSGLHAPNPAHAVAG